MSFSEKLQKLRKANGLSQEGLADLLDVTRQSVSKWESGTTYPEMDKLLSMCKIFKCSLDDLTNDEITDIKIDEKKKNSLYTLIDSILYFINQTYQTCKTMTVKEIIHLIVSMIIVVLILFVFRIPFHLIESFFKSLLQVFHNDFIIRAGYFIIELLINVAYFSLFAIIFIYIFKMICLDSEKYKDRKVMKKTETEKIPSIEKEIIIEEKEIEHKKRHKIETASSTLYRFLSTIVVFVGKAAVCLFTFPVLILLFFLCAALFITLYLLFKGVIYISILIGIPFAILLLLIVLELFFSFVLNKKTNEKRMGILFLVSIIGLGSSFGILLLDMSSISYIDEVPPSVVLSTEEKTYEMTDNLYFLFQNMVEYVPDQTLAQKVRIEIDYYNDYTEILFPLEANSFYPYYEKPYIFVNQNLLSLIIRDLAQRKIYNYGYLNEIKIRLYASEENIKILKENYQKNEEQMMLGNREQECKNNYLWEYQNEIELLEQEKERLENEKEELETSNQDLEATIQEYKQKIEEYKNKLQAIIEEQ